jgi:hypothetical protein
MCIDMSAVHGVSDPTNENYFELGCLCPVVVHNGYMVLDRRTHNIHWYY